jgi:hypothetical protein
VRIGDNVETQICDTLYKENGFLKILEVDLKQTMAINKEKIRAYAGILKRGTATKQLGYFPIVVWLTTTELRRKQLKSICKEFDLPAEVYTKEDIR